MFLWWRKRRCIIGPSHIGIDVHCHLLPGVDDGADDEEEAVACLCELAAMGYRGAVLTPHIYPEVFDNDEEDLTRRFHNFLSSAASRLPPAFQLTLGAEYMFDDSLIGRLYDHHERLLTFGPGRRWLLVELPTIAMPSNLGQFVSECARRGIQPVLAHIERYPYLHERDMDGLREWRAGGGLLQVNIGTFAGGGDGFRCRAARAAARRRLVDLIGTDLHNPGQLRLLRDGWRAASRWLRDFTPALQASGLSDRGGPGLGSEGGGGAGRDRN
ncbi:MAG: hypothetical protein JJU36_14545 [Phycisphaeraceae bacterium]|nr:hypothetical protein [Phycisphaeraceae bacterium]